MQKIYRIIDANINRVSEGLRVLEDLSRFYYDESALTEEIKRVRHRVRKSANKLYSQLIVQRDSIDDKGLAISKKDTLDNKANLKELISANFKRVQEGLRTIEETLKIVGNYELSKIYEDIRYDSYTLEKIYYSKFIRPIKKDILSTDLYCFTGQEYSMGRNNIQVVKQMIDSGIKIIQYREKDKKALYKYEECKKIRELTKQAGVTFIVNDDISIAMSVKADGIHIGQEDLPIEEVRALVGDEMIIGLSTHSSMQAQDAVNRGADYIGVGPIFRTFTKKDVCDPVGLEYLEYVVKSIDIPFVAIGGIKETNISEVIKRGAKCVGIITEIVGAQNIQSKIESLRHTIKECEENIE